MLTMWADNVAAPLNVVHLGYGFGAVFTNLLVRPFLSQGSQSDIRIPYSIISIICFIITIGHLFFAIREHQMKKNALQNRPVEYSSVSTTKETTKTEKEISSYSPRSCGNGYFGYGLSMSIIWIFYMFFLSGNDQTFGKFFFTYIKKKNPEPQIDAVVYMIVYWLSYSVRFDFEKKRRGRFCFCLGWSDRKSVV